MTLLKMTTTTTVPRRRNSWHPSLHLILALALLSSRVIAFAPYCQRQRLLSSTRSRWNKKKNTSVPLNMALTPTGPFCPFRSSAAEEMEPRMEHLKYTATPEIATEMARIQLDLQTGNTPDPDRLRRVAKGIEEAVDEWESLLTRLNLSNDFQTREYAKLTQAHLATHNMDPEKVAKIMRWQTGCMNAMADNTPPPMPPSDLDLMQMMEASKSHEENPVPSITSMTAAEKITATPFNGEEEVFQSPTVKEEYEKLCRDHAGLVEMGASYANFDPSGKIAFLDEIEKVEERWQIFMARFKLLGQLNDDFVQQCNDFLASMNMTEEQYNELLKKTHDLMRQDAEKERNMMARL